MERGLTFRLETAGRDVRYALRMLRKNPGFTVVAVLTLALGIGATTTFYSVTDTLILKPLPYIGAERLTYLNHVHENGAVYIDTSLPEFEDWQTQPQLFDEVIAYAGRSATLVTGDDPEKLAVVRCSANFLTMLAARPALGRFFQKDEEPRQSEPVAVLGHALWQRRFGGDPAVLGRVITLDGHASTIVGVMPRGVSRRVPAPGDESPQVFLPLRLEPGESAREHHQLFVMGRLRAGLTLQLARDEAQAVVARWQEEGRTRHGVQMVSLKQQITGWATNPLFSLLGAAGFLLLITCANLTNLLLARGAARKKEIVLRLALGARRFGLVRQLLTESLLLALAGGCLGVLLAWWGVTRFARGLLAGLPQVDMLQVDANLLLFALTVSVVTGLLFGLVPALHAVRADLNQGLKEGGRQQGASRGANRLRGGLVVAEVALSLVLLVGAGLLMRTFVALTAVDVGFDTDGLVSVTVSLPETAYDNPTTQLAFFDEAHGRIAALPGVQSAALVNVRPLQNRVNSDFEIVGQTPTADQPLAAMRVVSPDYFRTLRTSLLRGRAFQAHDTAASLPVAIVSRRFADTFFPDQDPLGQHVSTGFSGERPMEIVGVAEDVKAGSVTGPAALAIYHPHQQAIRGSMTFLLRTTADAAGLVPAVREQVRAIDKHQPISNVQTADQFVARQLAPARLASLLFGAFAGLALALASLGIYGVMSYSVSQRTQEIGIRASLGARAVDILALFVRRGMLLVLMGLALGLAGAGVLARLISSQLFGVTAADPATFASISLLLLIVALAACILPGRRAMRLDPVAALREG